MAKETCTCGVFIHLKPALNVCDLTKSTAFKSLADLLLAILRCVHLKIKLKKAFSEEVVDGLVFHE